MKSILSILTVIFFSLLFTSSVGAQYGQYQLPTQTQSILVDKRVALPISQTKGGETVDYVDNLTNNDYKFKPESEVTFQIKVKNTANTILDNITIKDVLPPNVTFVDGGEFDANSNTVTINVGSLNIDQEKVYLIKVRVVSQDQLPQNRGVICLTNNVRAFNEKVSDDDTAQFCIEKQVMGAVETTPSAGPEEALILYSLSGLIGLAGLKLRRIS